MSLYATACHMCWYEPIPFPL